ncbi:MAG: hypothetical protein IIZ39_13780, partial [Blautia sp.]|nr:hypothetical protein [Blautia sp.]
MGDSWDTYRKKRQKKRLEALGGASDSLPSESDAKKKESGDVKDLGGKEGGARRGREESPPAGGPGEESFLDETVAGETFSLDLEDFVRDELEEEAGLEPEPTKVMEPEEKASGSKRGLSLDDVPKRQTEAGQGRQGGQRRASSSRSSSARPSSSSAHPASSRSSSRSAASAKAKERKEAAQRAKAKREERRRASARPAPPPQPKKSPKQLERERKKRREMTIKVISIA